jgi:hypothetical protein
VEQAAAASQSIVDLAQSLNNLVAGYRVDEETQAAVQDSISRSPGAPATGERRSQKRSWSKSMTRKAANGSASSEPEWKEFWASAREG